MFASAIDQLKFAAGSCSNGIFPGGPGLYDGLCNGKDVKVSSLQDFIVVVGNVVRILIALSGGLALIFIIVGGIYYVVSAGDPGRLKQAKEIIVQAIVGLVVISISYALVTLITGRL